MGVLGCQSVQVELEANVDLASLELPHDPMLDPGTRKEQVVVRLDLMLREPLDFIGVRLRGLRPWHRRWPPSVRLRLLLPQWLGVGDFCAKYR